MIDGIAGCVEDIGKPMLAIYFEKDEEKKVILSKGILPVDNLNLNLHSGRTMSQCVMFPPQGHLEYLESSLIKKYSLVYSKLYIIHQKAIVSLLFPCHFTVIFLWMYLYCCRLYRAHIH